MAFSLEYKSEEIQGYETTGSLWNILQPGAELSMRRGQNEIRRDVASDPPVFDFLHSLPVVTHLHVIWFHVLWSIFTQPRLEKTQTCCRFGATTVEVFSVDTSAGVGCTTKHVTLTAVTWLEFNPWPFVPYRLFTLKKAQVGLFLPDNNCNTWRMNLNFLSVLTQ